MSSDKLINREFLVGVKGWLLIMKMVWEVWCTGEKFQASGGVVAVIITRSWLTPWGWLCEQSMN